MCNALKINSAKNASGKNLIIELYAQNRTVMQLRVANALPENRSQVPLSWSIPLGQGDNLTDTGNLTLLRNGTEVPVQFTPMARWGGSLQPMPYASSGAFWGYLRA